MESKQEAQEESEETSIVLARRTSITLEDRQRITRAVRLSRQALPDLLRLLGGPRSGGSPI